MIFSAFKISTLQRVAMPTTEHSALYNTPVHCSTCCTVRQVCALYNTPAQCTTRPFTVHCTVPRVHFVALSPFFFLLWERMGWTFLGCYCVPLFWLGPLASVRWFPNLSWGSFGRLSPAWPSREPSDMSGFEHDGRPWDSLVLSAFGPKWF